MRYSKYNIFSKIRDSENFFIVNLLNGNADIITSHDAERLKVLRQTGVLTDQIFAGELAEKGYLMEEAVEKSLYRNRYLDFIDSRETDEIQIFFVTNYSCNFACTYCCQDQYANPVNGLIEEVIVLFLTDVISGTLGIILLILAGIFVVTSFLSFCPLYLPFGLSTKKKE